MHHIMSFIYITDREQLVLLTKQSYAFRRKTSEIDVHENEL